MKILRERINKKGMREVTVELGDNEQIMSINPDGHYMTDYPLENVIAGHIMLNSNEVDWCSLEQKWLP